MKTNAATEGAAPFRPGIVIAPAREMAGLPDPEGYIVPTERLGPGVVEQLTADGRVWVRWVAADFETCCEPCDLRPLGSDAHLLTIMRRDKQGHTRLLKHTVVSGVGMQNNWVVEFLPNNVLRAIRPDGASWTFPVNRMFKCVMVWWRQPPRDDDAEALLAAETALRRRN